MGSMIETIPAGSRIALDTVVFVYFLERQDPFGARATRLFERIEAGDLHAVMSSLVLAELLVPLYRSRQHRDASALTRRLQHFRHLEIKPVSDQIAADAARLRAEYRLRTPDAIHAATALAAEASGLVTHDRAFLSLQRELEIWTFSS